MTRKEARWTLIFFAFVIISLLYSIFGDRASFITKGRIRNEIDKIPYTTEEIYNQTTGRTEIKEKFESKEDEKRLNELRKEYTDATIGFYKRLLISFGGGTAAFTAYFIFIEIGSAILFLKGCRECDEYNRRLKNQK